MSTAEGTQTETNGTVVSFDDMFKELALLEDGQEPSKKADEAPATAPAPEAAAPEAAPAETPAEAPAEAPAEPPKAEAKPEAKANDDTDEVLQRLARLVKEEPAPQAAPQPEQAPPPAQEHLYSKEEEELLQNYEKDWPDVAKAEALRRRAEYRELVSYVFTEVAKELRPLVETVQVLGNRTHLDDLRTTVTDYEDVRDKVIDWVETQPDYLQNAYKHVIQHGTVDQVADLVSRYKRETGASVAPASAPAPVKKDTELPSATKQAAAELAPVSSKRAAVVASAEPETFEDAFAMFAKS